MDVIRSLVRPYSVERHTLANGLRVLFAPDRSAPVVGIIVLYDVGMRSEPPTRSGFAHLFEHLMFQGSENLPKHAHFRYVESSGGMFNGSTHFDYTQYYQILPSNALERGLFLEADRMRAPQLDENNLRLQVEVVKEEIRANVTNKPYGAFPWVNLPGALFQTFANAHDGYGSFTHLETATVEDAHQFFDRYYAPANALLCVVGDVDPDMATTLIDRYFAPIPYRPGPPPPRLSEPDLLAERRVVRLDPHAPLPAVAAGWRVPDPVGDWDAYLPYVLLTRILSASDSSRLERRLVHGDRIASHQTSYVGLLGDPFDVRDPTGLVVQVRHAQATPVDAILATVDEEVRRVAENGLGDGELRRAMIGLAAQILRETDGILGRSQALASFELIHGRAESLVELPRLLSTVGEDQIRAAAATLTPDRRAVAELRPANVADRTDHEKQAA